MGYPIYKQPPSKYKSMLDQFKSMFPQFENLIKTWKKNDAESIWIQLTDHRVLIFEKHGDDWSLGTKDSFYRYK